MMVLTAKQLMIATGCTAERAGVYLPFLQGAMKAYAITSPKRIAGFLSQISHESAQLSQLVESLNYSTTGLRATFSRSRISDADCQRLGRAAGRPAQQEAIANTIYGGDWGRRNLGNTQPGDGWKFRGRGLKQLTGRDNYARCSAAIGETFLEDPDRVLMPVNAALSAGWFWSTHGLNDLADRGDVPAMTKAINGGANGLKERTALYGQALGVFA